MNQHVRRGATLGLGLVFLFGIGGFFQANARPAFAAKEKRKCLYCHLNPGGGSRGFRGIYYKLHDHSFKDFVEKTEAAKAGVAPDATGKDAKPTKSYP